MTQPHTHSRVHNEQNTNLELYKSLFAVCEDAVFILTANLAVQYANHAAEKFFGFSHQNCKIKALKDFFPTEALRKLNAVFKKIAQDPHQFRFEVHTLNRHQERNLCEVTATPILQGAEVMGFFMILRDIHQERQIEDLVRESEKMEAIQYFVTGTTKELKHPLMAILKRIESIEDKYKGRSFEYVTFKEFTHIMSFLQSMHKQIKYCYDTTTKLTHMNKKHLKYERSYCQANDVISEVLRLKGNYLKLTNVKIKLKLMDHLPLIAIGEIEFNQIMSNIIDNGIQAMPAGGQLSMTSSVTPDRTKVKIDIVDEGVGISVEELPHIFEPFFTTKQRGMDRNAGLGLSIVYSLVKSAHGHIQVKSSLRKGTTVQLSFPIAKVGKPPKS